MKSRSVLLLLPALAFLGAACGSNGATTARKLVDETEGDASADAAAATTRDGGPAADAHPGSSTSDGGQLTERTDDGGAPQDDAEAPPPDTTDGGATNDCSSATDLGTLAGDIGSASEAAQGHCAQWFKLRVNETASDTCDMSLDFTLVSPESAKFDLYVYVNTSTDAVECSTVSASSSDPLSRTDSVHLSWVDWPFSDQSRTVSIEVRSHDGACVNGDPWSLAVTHTTVDPVCGLE